MSLLEPDIQPLEVLKERFNLNRDALRNRLFRGASVYAEPHKGMLAPYPARA